MELAPEISFGVLSRLACTEPLLLRISKNPLTSPILPVVGLEAHVLILVDEVRIGRHHVETVGRHVGDEADRVTRFTGGKCPGGTQRQNSQMGQRLRIS